MPLTTIDPCDGSICPMSSLGMLLRLRSGFRSGLALSTRRRSRNTFKSSQLNIWPRDTLSSSTKSYNSLNFWMPSSDHPMPASPFVAKRCLRDRVYFGGCYVKQLG